MTAAALATISWGVLAFGAVAPWASWPLMWGAIVTGMLGLRAGAGVRSTLGNSVTSGVLVLSAAVLLQLAPLPPAVLGRISPSTRTFVDAYVHVPAEAMTVVSGGARPTTPVTEWQPLSLHPEATLGALLFLATLGLMVVGGVSGLGVRGACRLAAGLIVLGAIVALAAIIQRAAHTALIYGFWRPRFGNQPFGPFVNRNHFAGWMVMAVSVGLGYFMAIAGHAMHGLKGWRSRVLWLSTPEASGLLLVGLALGVMGLSLVLTVSRSGVGSFVLALLVVSACALGRRTNSNATKPRRVVMAAYLVCLGLVTVVWTGLPAISSRFSYSSTATPFSLGGRSQLWRDALEVIRRFPLTGTGLGTYTAVTPFFQTGVTPTSDEAHSDYLQLAADGGLLLGLPVIGLVLVFGREVGRRFQASGPSVTSYWLRVGAVAGLIAIATQELVEFSLQLPGNAVMFAALCAIAAHRPDASPEAHEPRSLRGLRSRG